MQVISKPTLKAFWDRHPEARAPLRAWHSEAKRATWSSMKEIKARYAHASVLNHERVVFNIHGNDFRLVVFIRFATRQIYVRFVGTHAEYGRIDALRV